MSMMMPGTTTASVVEVISAYSAANQMIPAVTATPGWFVIGSFFMPKSAPVKLELIGVVSAGGLVMRARLFDLSTATPVSGTTTPNITSIVPDERQVSGAVDLTGGRSYQIQVEVIGAVADSFGVVRNAAPISAG